jgi:hypothetical protein
MGTYFDYFPKIKYDISQTDRKNYDLITDVFFRFKFIDKIKRMKVAYLPYIVKDGETPEIIADKMYNDPQAHWVILLINDIVDPHTQWYMDAVTFDNYIRKKYGSVAQAYNTVHHYEKLTSTRVVGYRDDRRNVFTNTTSQIDGTDLFISVNNTFSNVQTVPYDSYDQMAVDEYEYTLGNSGRQLEVGTFKNVVNCYDWELAENEKRQTIKLVYREAYSQIRAEFEAMVAAYNPARRLNLRVVRV